MCDADNAKKIEELEKRIAALEEIEERKELALLRRTSPYDLSRRRHT